MLKKKEANYNTRDQWIFKNLVDYVNEGIIILNKDGIVIYTNHKINELLGYKPNELLLHTTQEIIALLLGKNSQSCQINDLCSAMKNEHSLIQRYKFIHKEGQTVPLEVQLRSINDEFGNYYCKAITLKDLHEQLLVEVTNLINSSLSLRETLNNTIHVVTDFLGLDSTAIFLINEENTELKMFCCNSFPSQDECEKIVVKVGECAPGLIAQNRTMAYVENLRLDTSIPEHARQFHSDKSSIGFPLICKDELLGVIAFDADRVREFSEKEINLFENIANQVALAIYNAQLFSKLKQLSSTDGLTGLYNHRYFQDLLNNELNWSLANKASFSVLMIDVDHFKIYNDTFGHLIGDKFLKELSILLLKNVRESDIVARYGGEEFSIILPNTTFDEAYKIAEGIRLAVQGFNFVPCKTKYGNSITISLGLAMFNNESSNSELLAKADQALYLAKQNGRNRIEVYYEE